MDGWIRRHLLGEGTEKSKTISGLTTVQGFQERGLWIDAAPDPETPDCLLHSRVFFPSYAHEWSASMLHKAASLTLEANQGLALEGWELKDATPTNVLFRGPRPVFIDHLSPTPREATQLGWRAYGQFVRTFLIPLMLHRLRKIPLRWMFLAHRDGVSPEQAYSMLGPLERLKSSVFPLVTLPEWLPARLGQNPRSSNARPTDPQVAAMVQTRILSSLARHLTRWAPSSNRGKSLWSDYQDKGVSYTAEGLAQKEAFVREALETCQPSSVLDLGCNTGKFSMMAARAGALVVALDSDPACVERLFLEADRSGLDILPLVADLGRPTPSLGWDCREEFSLQERMEGRFAMTLALALVHHLLIRERVPLPEVLRFFHRTSHRHVLLEWVPPTDPQFRVLAGPNLGLYQGLGWKDVRPQVEKQFSILKEYNLGHGENPDTEGRTLLLLEKL